MSTWIARSCKANGITIHYLRTGGDKPSVVLLHGLTKSGACWASLAQALEGEYDVIMPDARGHGNSSASKEGYCYDNLAIDVVSLIEVLKLSTPALVGHSMGGMTAAVAANRHPERIRGIVLADPTFLSPERQCEVYESDVAIQHRRILSQPRENFLDEIRMQHNHRSDELIELFVEARFQTSPHAFEILTPPNPDYSQLIKNLEIPSLLVIGDTNSVVSLEVATELSKLNQCLKVAQIAKAGHGIPFDQPERFAVVVKDFLRSLTEVT
jgi:pimeloyl-ACP methyl ester carboxylesterase